MDPYCASAREKIKKVVGRPDADVHFLVGGTQTNMTVIAAALKPVAGRNLCRYRSYCVP